MSDKPIQVGDLVMVVRSCCDRHTRTPVFVVSSIEPPCDEECKFCGYKFVGVTEACDGEGWSYPLLWLKRLDPDALKDDVPTKQEIEA